MKKARIEAGRVVELLDSGGAPFPPFHASLQWVACGAGVKEGDSYAAGVFSAYVPPPKTTEQSNAEAQAELAQIDAASIRAMREYIAGKADAPQLLKDRETAAQAARAKLK